MRWRGFALQMCTPHVTPNHGLTKTGRWPRSAIDGRTTRHTGYAKSQSRGAAATTGSSIYHLVLQTGALVRCLPIAPPIR